MSFLTPLQYLVAQLSLRCFQRAQPGLQIWNFSHCFYGITFHLDPQAWNFSTCFSSILFQLSNVITKVPVSALSLGFNRLGYCCIHCTLKTNLYDGLCDSANESFTTAVANIICAKGSEIPWRLWFSQALLGRTSNGLCQVSIGRM